MSKIIGLFLLVLVSYSCKNVGSQTSESASYYPIQEVITENYHLHKPTNGTKKVIILFGGFPEKAEDIKREFKINEAALEKGIALVYMNYNQKLWLEKTEKNYLANLLQEIILEYQLPKDEVYIGGFSSGGNMALLISAFIMQNKHFDMMLKGVFIVDSPIDLVALYKSSEKNIANDFSDVSVQESTWIIETLEREFGSPYDDISKYQEYAVYTSETNSIDNVKVLSKVKIRLYTEPDTLWWKENRNAEYDQMNAYYIKRFAERLQTEGFNQVEYIPTENKGFRANGDRHPHSWSIIDKDDLLRWIME